MKLVIKSSISFKVLTLCIQKNKYLLPTGDNLELILFNTTKTELEQSTPLVQEISS